MYILLDWMDLRKSATPPNGMKSRLCNESCEQKKSPLSHASGAKGIFLCVYQCLLLQALLTILNNGAALGAVGADTLQVVNRRLVSGSVDGHIVNASRHDTNNV